MLHYSLLSLSLSLSLYLSLSLSLPLYLSLSLSHSPLKGVLIRNGVWLCSDFTNDKLAKPFEALFKSKGNKHNNNICYNMKDATEPLYTKKMAQGQ